MNIDQVHQIKIETVTATGARLIPNQLVERAAAQAEQDFQGRWRKIPPGFPDAPKTYYSHLQAVATTLQVYGYSHEGVAAGYLHDHLEDLPQLWNRLRLEACFGSTVATLVDWVTQQDKSLSWEERNERYALRLRQAPDEALAISAADKLSNISDLLPFLRAGIPVSHVLKRGWRVNSEKFHELLGIFEGRVKPGLVTELKTALATFDELGARLEPQ